MAFTAIALFGTNNHATYAATSIDPEEQSFMNLLNAYRADPDGNPNTNDGMPPLAIDTSMTNASEWMSTDLGENAYFDHTDSTGRDPWTRLCNFGYCYNTWRGENIAAGYTTAADVFAAWKASSGHNANMLNPNFKVMGLSRLYVPGSKYGYYWTNDFGGFVPPNQPAAPTAAPTPSPTRAPTPAPTTAPTPAPTNAPTPAPTATQAPGCTNDTDCDGWSNADEVWVGTNPNRKCSSTFNVSDEPIDSLPTDLNDDRVINLADWLLLSKGFGKSIPRDDLNADGHVNASDLLMLNPVMFSRC